MSTNIQVEILKAKRLPQKEFDPMPPSASVTMHAHLLSQPLSSVSGGAPLPNPFEERYEVRANTAYLDTRTCKHTCAPFFSEKTEVVVEDKDSMRKPRGVPFNPLPPILMGSSSPNKAAAAAAGRAPSISVRPAFLALEITLFNHNEAGEAGSEKVEGPRPMMFGVVNIPLPSVAAGAAGEAPPPVPSTIKEITYNVTLSEDRVDLVDASVAEDDPTVTGPLLIIRYKVVPPPVVGDTVDPHADVMLFTEPQLSGSIELIRENSQYVWYNLLNDRKWQMAFTQMMLQQWPKFPKTIIGGPKRAKSPPKQRRSSSIAPAPLPSVRVSERTPSYKSVSELMARHWCVRRTHQALTKLRMCAEKFQVGQDSLYFTPEQEATKKLEWRERQVLRLGLALKSLEGLTSTSPVRLLLDKLWLNMVYNIRADHPAPPVLTFEMKHKLQTISFQQKHAKVLQACLLQMVVPGGLSYTEASIIAEEDLDPKNVQYVSHRSSLVGGEYVPTEGIMMAYGTPVDACEPRPKRDIAPLEHIDRLLESTAQSVLKKTLTPAQQRAAIREQKEAGLNNTTNNRSQLEGTNEEIPDELPLIKRTGQQMFTTVLVEFVGRMLDTMTDHEFMLILQAVIPAVSAAAEKCLMSSGGIAPPSRKRSKSAARRKSSTKTVTTKGKTNSNESGAINIDHLDSLGRRKPKASASATSSSLPPVTPTNVTTTTSSTFIEE